MIASYPEVSVIPLKTGTKFSFILPKSHNFPSIALIASPRDEALATLMLYPISTPWYCDNVLHHGSLSVTSKSKRIKKININR